MDSHSVALPPRRLSPEALLYWRRRAGALTPRIESALAEIRVDALREGYDVAGARLTYEDRFGYGGWLMRRVVRCRVTHSVRGDVRRYVVDQQVAPSGGGICYSFMDDVREAEAERERSAAPAESVFRPQDWPHPGGDVDHEPPRLSLPPPWGPSDPSDDSDLSSS